MLGVVTFLIAFLVNRGIIPALAFGLAGGLGIPNWMLKFLKKRREAKFLDALPDAVDVIVRGIKAGLPLLDSMKLIASEATEPIRSEFRGIIETQAVGIPLGEASLKLYERIPVAEANFFGIVDFHSAARRRQSLRGARQSFTRAARPQKDESEDQGHVAGSQGFGCDHRLFAPHRDGLSSGSPARLTSSCCGPIRRDA